MNASHALAIEESIVAPEAAPEAPLDLAYEEYRDQLAQAQELLASFNLDAFQVFPATILNLYRLGGWKRRFKRFYQFVEAAPFDGLGMSWGKLYSLCSHYPAARELLLEESPSLEEKPRPVKGETNAIRVFTRLGRSKDDRAPEMQKRLKSGELTATAVEFSMGWRQPQITILLTTASVATQIARHFTYDQWQEISAAVESMMKLQNN